MQCIADASCASILCAVSTGSSFCFIYSGREIIDSKFISKFGLKKNHYFVVKKSCDIAG